MFKIFFQTKNISIFILQITKYLPGNLAFLLKNEMFFYLETTGLITSFTRNL